MKQILFALVASMALMACGSKAKTDSTTPPNEQACTEEAKVCEDGSSVARGGPDCEFALCPGEEPAPAATICTEEAQVCPDGSSVGRVGPDCEFAACPE